MASENSGEGATQGLRQVDLAFAMDCTGSMSSYIQQAQENIRKITEEIVVKEKVDLRLALVEYRDHPPQESTFVTNVLDFTDRVREMKARLDQCSAAGGGDTPEAVADALHAVLKLTWRETAVKICVFIADAPPHGLGCSGDGFATGCPCGLDPMVTAHELAEKEISVYTVGCEPSIREYREWFMAISHITAGQYVPLASAKLLAQVIIGGASEEISLANLLPEVMSEVETTVTESGGAASTEDIDERVYQKLKDAKTKQVRSDTGALQSATKQAARYAELKSMAEVRSAYEPDRSHTALSGAAAAPSCYEVVECSLTKSQASRMVRKTMASYKSASFK